MVQPIENWKIKNTVTDYWPDPKKYIQIHLLLHLTNTLFFEILFIGCLSL